MAAPCSRTAEQLAITISLRDRMACKPAYNHSVTRCFFMDNASLIYLNRSEGWEIGVGPSIVVVDKGVAKSLTTTTAKSGVNAFVFDQKGLMAGLGLQGSKISRLNRIRATPTECVHLEVSNYKGTENLSKYIFLNSLCVLRASAANLGFILNG